MQKKTSSYMNCGSSHVVDMQVCVGFQDLASHWSQTSLVTFNADRVSRFSNRDLNLIGHVMNSPLFEGSRRQCVPCCTMGCAQC
jgi:hypothetical protein